MSSYYVTGNEYISLPTISADTGAVEGITFLHMGAKGMLQIKGCEQMPLMLPFIFVDGKEVLLEDFSWSRDHYWIPRFTATAGDITVSGCLLAPIGERGFVYRLTVSCDDKAEVKFGLRGCFGETFHEINETKVVKGEKNAYDSGWNHAFVMDLRAGLPLFAFAPIVDPEVGWEYWMDKNHDIFFSLTRTVELGGKEEATADFIWGLGYEEVAAATSAKEIYRRGFAKEYEKTVLWLSARERQVTDQKFCETLNLNMFFTFFFASGITLDTEEFCLVTSRSPRYYVSAAYWDRDSLLWSFPAILLADATYAREILMYVFKRQIRNVGIHSRFIDGTVLEPGFELDQLCAPVIALRRYVDVTGDRSVLDKELIREGVLRILRILDSVKHPDTDLYETFLQPTDDMHVYKYLTYDNMLVWRMLSDLTHLFGFDLADKAAKVKQAIYANCVKEKDGKPVFSWSVNLLGDWDFYDEPPGSLLLMAWYGFCDAEDEVYQNTVKAIRDTEYAYSFSGSPIAEIGCPHAPHPWVLSICNSLLCGYSQSALEHLAKTAMDNGIACESVHEQTGECMTGEAFATCAGFLAFALDEAVGGK